MSENLKPDKEPLPEKVTAEIRDFIEMLSRSGFDPQLLSTIHDQIIPGLNYLEDDSRRSFFWDVGLINDGVPSGEYQIVLGSESVSRRAGLLAGLVKPEQAQQLGYKWILGHELGHMLQSAYGLLHGESDSYGIFKPVFPTETHFAREGRTDADSNERRRETESQAEGLAKLALLDALVSGGMSQTEAIESLDDIYRKRRAELASKAIEKDYFFEHEAGYSNPLSLEELLDRFNN